MFRRLQEVGAELKVFVKDRLTVFSLEPVTKGDPNWDLQSTQH